MRTLNIDVTELVNQLDNFGYCTGIHKVTLDYIKEIRKNDSEKNISVRYIYKKKNGFYNYDIKKIIKFISSDLNDKTYKGYVYKHKPLNTNIYSLISKRFRNDIKKIYEGMKSFQNIIKNTIRIKNNKLLYGTLEDISNIEGCYVNFGMDYTDINYIKDVFKFTKENKLETTFYIHDLIPIVKPQYFTEYHNKIFGGCISELVKKSDKIVCISQSTKHDLVKEFNRKDVHVIKNGYFPEHNIYYDNRDINNVTKIIPEINENYVLSVGTIENRKNQEMLFDIWEKYISQNIEVPKLVLVGGFGYHSERLKNKLITTNFLNNKIIVINSANDNLVRLLYHYCLFTIYPSFYEGWGLPVVESLHNNRVCIAGDNKALKEASDNYAIHIDPFDQQKFYSEILKLLEDEEYLSDKEYSIRRFKNVYYYDSLFSLLYLLDIEYDKESYVI